MSIPGNDPQGVKEEITAAREMSAQLLTACASPEPHSGGYLCNGSQPEDGLDLAGDRPGAAAPEPPVEVSGKRHCSARSALGDSARESARLQECVGAIHMPPWQVHAPPALNAAVATRTGPLSQKPRLQRMEQRPGSSSSSPQGRKGRPTALLMTPQELLLPGRCRAPRAGSASHALWWSWRTARWWISPNRGARSLQAQREQKVKVPSKQGATRGKSRGFFGRKALKKPLSGVAGSHTSQALSSSSSICKWAGSRNSGISA